MMSILNSMDEGDSIDSMNSVDGVGEAVAIDGYEGNKTQTKKYKEHVEKCTHKLILENNHFLVMRV